MSTYEKVTNMYTSEEKQLYWNIGIGLQAVDHLKPSDYLLEQQKREVTGEITLEEVKTNLHRYYTLRKEEANLAEKEADFSSLRINGYLRESKFRLHPLALKSIHRYIFDGLDGFHAGQYRAYNISKAEPVLPGYSVRYEDYHNIDDYIEYDISKETNISAKRSAFDLNAFMDFITGLWQIHPFGEGNTRTIAVFTIQYLNDLGFQINNEPFEKNARYFRDALVRASYSNMELRISPNYSFLRKFFENVLYNNNHALNSEDLIIEQSAIK